MVNVIEKFDSLSKVTITTTSSIIPIWVYTYAVQCGPVTSNQAVSQFPSIHQQTGDGFVWKEGSRIGWVDDQTNTYFRLDQLEVTKSAKPVVKASARGVKILSTLDAAISGADQAASTPPEATIERTGDGFIWRSGKRIGWVGMTPAQYYRIDQVEVGRDGSVTVKSGENGSLIEQGRLFDAVVRADAAKI